MIKNLILALNIFILVQLIICLINAKPADLANQKSGSDHLYCNYQTYPVTGLIALDQGLLASGSNDSLVKVWNTSSPNCGQSLVFTGRSHSKAVSVLAKVANGIIASGSDDNTVKIWNWRTNSLLYTFRNHSKSITSLLLLKNGNLASASDDKTIMIYNIVNGKYRAIKQLNQHIDRVTCLDQLDNGFLISGSVDYLVIVWNQTNYKPVYYLEGHSDSVMHVLALPTNKFVSGSDDNTALVWDGISGNLLFNFSHGGPVTALARLDSGYLATGSQDKLVRVFDFTLGSLIKTLSGHSSQVISLQALPGNFLASGGAEANLFIWNLNLNNSKELVSSYNGQNSPVDSLAYLTNGYIASGSDKLNIWKNYRNY